MPIVPHLCFEQKCAAAHTEATAHLVHAKSHPVSSRRVRSLDENAAKAVMSARLSRPALLPCAAEPKKQGVKLQEQQHMHKVSHS